jgi:hypothetical protein
MDILERAKTYCASEDESNEIKRLLCEEVERLRAALEMYADPFAWKKKHDPDNVFNVPDFYNEMCFGDTAVEALAGNEQTMGSEKE